MGFTYKVGKNLSVGQKILYNNIWFKIVAVTDNGIELKFKNAQISLPFGSLVDGWRVK